MNNFLTRLATVSTLLFCLCKFIQGPLKQNWSNSVLQAAFLVLSTCRNKQLIGKRGIGYTIRILVLVLFLHCPNRFCTWGLGRFTIILNDMNSAHCRLCFCRSQSQVVMWLCIIIQLYLSNKLCFSTAFKVFDTEQTMGFLKLMS
jgi:hypothetical protein